MASLEFRSESETIFMMIRNSHWRMKVEHTAPQIRRSLICCRSFKWSDSSGSLQWCWRSSCLWAPLQSCSQRWNSRPSKSHRWQAIKPSKRTSQWTVQSSSLLLYCSLKQMFCSTLIRSKEGTFLQKFWVDEFWHQAQRHHTGWWEASV